MPAAEKMKKLAELNLIHDGPLYKQEDMANGRLKAITPSILTNRSHCSK